MTPERFRRVDQLVSLALKRQASERAEFIREACAGEEDLRSEVESVLASHNEKDSFLVEGPAGLAAQLLAENASHAVSTSSAPPAGFQIGAYTLERLIGEGGMGSVWLARRADGRFEGSAAIKLLNLALLTPDGQQRFRREGTFLARLGHPGIARLLDAGVAENGQPYLVLEHVDGTRIDLFADQRCLALPDRLRLVLQVLSAVGHAHTNLIVHRDLKPSNILVSKDGTAKLLDFGIAKLLAEEGNLEQTATHGWALTPDFAAPEQVSGGMITTATDIYATGVLLYRLLTGCKPYDLSGRSAVKIGRIICETMPPRPSATFGKQAREDVAERARVRGGSPDRLSRQLLGDLDAIVMKALHKEPERRYRAAAALAEDIERYLDERPVVAGPDRVGYRARKFVRRHKAAVAAAALVGLSLLGGTVATLRQARIAEANRARAERRFNEVRKLANAVIFKYHDGIAELPGATSVRQMLVNDGLEYLDNLSRESEGDVSLLKELAKAYDRVGNVQGSPNTGSVGDTRGALSSFRKAQTLWEKIVALEPTNPENQRRLGGSYLTTVRALQRTSDLKAALELARKGLVINQTLAERYPDPTFRGELARGYWMVADVSDDLEEKIGNFRKAASIYEELSAADPRHLRNTALSYKYLSTDLKKSGDLAGGLESAWKALAIDERRAESDPSNVTAKLDLSFSRSQVGYALLETGDEEGVLASFKEALQLRLAIAHADPKNAQAQLASAVAYEPIGDLLAKRGELSSALEDHLRAEEMLEGLTRNDPANMDTASRAAKSRFKVGATYAQLASDEKSPASERLARWRTARSWLQRSAESWSKLGGQEQLRKVYREEPQKVADELARCDAEIAKFTNRTKE